MWQRVTSIYNQLTGLELPDEMPPRESRRVDGVLAYPIGDLRIIEVDESQHFNRFRAMTLESYDDHTPVAFDVSLWLEECRRKTRLEGGGFAKPKLLCSPARMAAIGSGPSAMLWQICSLRCTDSSRLLGSATSRMGPESAAWLRAASGLSATARPHRIR